MNNNKNEPEKKWFDCQGLKCVVLCAGQGLRARPETREKPKVLMKIKDRPILSYIIDYWKRFSSDFVFIVGYQKEQVIKFVRDLPINAQFVEQKELKGIGDAIFYSQALVGDRFIVILGDCICRGEFSFPPGMEQGIGVWPTSNEEEIKKSYSVTQENNLVCQVVEKPTELFNDSCGMGFYFFRKTVFEYIKRSKPSKLRNEVEITNVIQEMIEGGEEIAPVSFHGEYINITYPEDTTKAEIFLE